MVNSSVRLRHALRTAWTVALVAVAACGSSSARPRAARPCSSPRLEVTNNASTSVEVYWVDALRRQYLGTANPGVSSYTVERTEGEVRYEDRTGRPIANRVGVNLSSRLVCM
jgi:hypothetical protein